MQQSLKQIETDLKYVLDGAGHKVVTAHQFGVFLQWFGPLSSSCCFKLEQLLWEYRDLIKQRLDVAVECKSVV